MLDLENSFEFGLVASTNTLESVERSQASSLGSACREASLLLDDCAQTEHALETKVKTYV